MDEKPGINHLSINRPRQRSRRIARFTTLPTLPDKAPTGLAGIVSANADEARFPDPARLDPARTENRHLAFGLGQHYCLGAPPARLEGRIAIGALIRRFPNLRLAAPPEQLRWRPGVSLRGLTALPVAL